MGELSNYLLLGFVAGFLSAFLGIGGGIIIVPALIILFNFSVKKAVGTSLAVIIFIVSIGIISHFLLNPENINFLAVLFILVGSLIGSGLGAFLIKKSPESLLKKIFALFLVLVAIRMAGLISFGTSIVGQPESIFSLALIFVGLIAGLVSAFFGIGGGLIYVPFLNIFFNFEIHSAIATSLALILPTVIFGAFFHKKMGNVDLGAVKFIAPTGFVGAALGAIAAVLMPSSGLKILFAFLLIIVAIKLFLLKDYEKK